MESSLQRCAVTLLARYFNLALVILVSKQNWIYYKTYSPLLSVLIIDSHRYFLLIIIGFLKPLFWKPYFMGNSDELFNFIII